MSRVAQVFLVGLLMSNLFITGLTIATVKHHTDLIGRLSVLVEKLSRHYHD